MGTIKGFLNKSKQALNSLDSDVQLAVKLVETELLDLNREDQLFQGIGADGKKIGKYSKATEEITEGRTGVGFPKKAGELFNFYDTGGVFKSFRYQILPGSKVKLFNTDPKIPKLNAKYKNNIIGLTPDNVLKFNYQILIHPLRSVIKRHF
jgi:hypothetical protein